MNNDVATDHRHEITRHLRLLATNRSPIAENVDDRFRRREPEWSVVLALIACGHDGGVFLGDNKLRVPTQELMCLLRRPF